MKKVLCVDDEPAILSSLKRLFRRYGLKIHTANSGDDALKLLQQEAYDLIISDMRMPGMSGSELLSQVNRQWPDMAKIALTGYAELSDTKTVTGEVSVDAYLHKPWSDTELINIVSEVLQQPFEPR